MILQGRFQIGKNGVTEGVINSLNQDLKNHSQIRISLLKSATRDRERMNQMAEEIINKVNYNCKYRIIGFKILLRRQSARQKSSNSI